MSVIVGVRVRPFNTRETKLNTTLCVEMDGKQTILKKPDGGTRSFAFDYSFWSHDGYTVEKDGYLSPKNKKFAD